MKQKPCGNGGKSRNASKTKSSIPKDGDDPPEAIKQSQLLSADYYSVSAVSMSDRNSLVHLHDGASTHMHRRVTW